MAGECQVDVVHCGTMVDRYVVVPYRVCRLRNPRFATASSKRNKRYAKAMCRAEGRENGERAANVWVEWVPKGEMTIGAALQLQNDGRILRRGRYALMRLKEQTHGRRGSSNLVVRPENGDVRLYGGVLVWVVVGIVIDTWIDIFVVIVASDSFLRGV